MPCRSAEDSRVLDGVHDILRRLSGSQDREHQLLIVQADLLALQGQHRASQASTHDKVGGELSKGITVSYRMIQT